jgi:pimeloyl-ACP methyl ester carboxylesterase
MYIQINDARLHYVVDGRGVPCMIMGRAGTPFYERTFSRRLRQSLHCVFVEPRGSGRSEGEIAAVTFETITADMDALRQALGIQRMLVLGQSGNGLMALAYARAYPEQTLGVVLVGTPPVRDGSEAVANFRAASMTPERRKIWQEKQERLTPEMLQALSPGEATLAGMLQSGRREIVSRTRILCAGTALSAIPLREAKKVRIACCFERSCFYGKATAFFG